MAGAKTDGETLDNAVWHALHGPQARFAERGSDGTAVRFDPAVSIFSAVDRLDVEAWKALADLVGPGGFAVLFRDEVRALPDGWEESFRGPGFQLVAGNLAPALEVEVVELGSDDADEMVALTQLTEPGPFLPRTHEMGTYVGVRRQGRLVAMAGERFRLPGWTEVSAVCTHPDAQRQGLGAALTLWMSRAIRERGDEAFLHVLGGNDNALRLYETLGFRLRRQVDVVAAEWTG